MCMFSLLLGSAMRCLCCPLATTYAMDYRSWRTEPVSISHWYSAKMTQKPLKPRCIGKTFGWVAYTGFCYPALRLSCNNTSSGCRGPFNSIRRIRPSFAGPILFAMFWTSFGPASGGQHSYIDYYLQFEMVGHTSLHVQASWPVKITAVFLHVEKQRKFRKVWRCGNTKHVFYYVKISD
jgi:hypothetical protein